MIPDTSPIVSTGSRLSNNDPRVPEAQRIITVVSSMAMMDPRKDYVTYQAATRLARIKLNRIFTDGKKRAQGYNLLPSF